MVSLRTRFRWYWRNIRHRVNYTRRVTVLGVTMAVPSINGVTCDTTEPWLLDLLAKLLPACPGVVLDVGVNVGQTLLKVKAVDRDRAYIGFEPNPVCVHYVQELIKANGFPGCTLLPVGLYTDNRVLALDLFSDDRTDSMASMVENFRPGRVHSHIFVPVFHGDSLASLIGGSRVGVIKIDVEGAELEVIKSLSSVIARDRPQVLLEVLPAYTADNTARVQRQQELEQIFRNLGYTAHRILKTAGRFTGLERIEAIGIHGDLDLSDYVFSPADTVPGLS